jgi:transcriptional regulator with XRE-family HTH domain
MTHMIDQALSNFIDDWNAGRRPDLDGYLESVAQDDRPQLAQAVATFLEHAPTPAYEQAAREQLRADPALAVARERLLGPALAEIVREQRAARRLSVGDLARRVGRAVGVSGREQRIEVYLDRLEHGELDGRRLTRRLLDALASALGANRNDLERASLRGLVPAGALFRTEDERQAGAVLEQLEAVADALYAAAPPERDEVDELFLGGR